MYILPTNFWYDYHLLQYMLLYMNKFHLMLKERCRSYLY